MSMEHVAPVPREYIIELLEKIDRQRYGWQIRGSRNCKRRLSPEEQRMRNKALISLLYLSARRISEIVGRVHVTKNGEILEWRGVTVKDFSRRKIRDRSGRTFDVLVMRCQILKKKKPHIAEVVMRLDDQPFISHILRWIEYIKQKWGESAKLFEITPERSLQILKKLDPNINNHWLRHMRLSHLAEFLNPYQLTERIGFWSSLGPAVSYVHGRLSDYLRAVERAKSL